MDVAIIFIAGKVKASQKNLLLILLLPFFFMGMSPVFGQHHVLDVGIRLQKSVNLYYENGFTLQYSNDQLLSEKLYLGLTYVSSRLGTALGSNALQQDNFLFSTSYFFRPERLIRPLLRANVGYFVADLEEAIFENLPDNSLLLSTEGGVSIEPGPLKVSASLGYNLITGDGLGGPGTVYPLYIQTSISWSIFDRGGK